MKCGIKVMDHEAGRGGGAMIVAVAHSPNAGTDSMTVTSVLWLENSVAGHACDWPKSEIPN